MTPTPWHIRLHQAMLEHGGNLSGFAFRIDRELFIVRQWATGARRPNSATRRRIEAIIGFFEWPSKPAPGGWTLEDEARYKYFRMLWKHSEEKNCLVRFFEALDTSAAAEVKRPDLLDVMERDAREEVPV